MGASSAKKEDFISISLLDSFHDTSVSAAQMVHKLQPEAEVWLGETSSAFDGGTSGLSDVFIAGFMYVIFRISQILLTCI